MDLGDGLQTGGDERIAFWSQLKRPRLHRQRSGLVTPLGVGGQ